MPKLPPDDMPLAAPPWQSGLSADPMLGVFRRHFLALRAAHAEQDQEGVLVAAVDRTGLFDAHAHLILGRHERCDFVLSRDPDVSLRHLLVRATRGPGRHLHLRAIDLRSRVGLLSEDGRRCEAIASQGPLFLQVASYVVFLLPTGPLVRPWTRDPDETWRGFSPRSQEILPPPQPLKSRDRKSTRLNSSHDQISYAVFCLKKKNITTNDEFSYKKQNLKH